MSPLAIAVQQHIAHLRGLAPKEPMTHDDIIRHLDALETSLRLVTHHYRALHNIPVDVPTTPPVEAKDVPENTLLRELYEVVLAQQEWIDAVPDEVQLPTMPGFDRDWADGIIQEVEASLGK